MTTICLGNKKNGARCTARTSNANGYCFQHQAQVPPPPAPAPVVPAPAPAPAPVPAPAATTNHSPWPWIIGAALLLALIVASVIGFMNLRLSNHPITINMPTQHPDPHAHAHPARCNPTARRHNPPDLELSALWSNIFVSARFRIRRRLDVRWSPLATLFACWQFACGAYCSHHSRNRELRVRRCRMRTFC